MYSELTQVGINFIRKKCEGNGNTLLRGVNPEGVLPYCNPKTSSNKIWEAQAYYNNKLITTNQQLGEALINWYNKYGKLYEMNANVMAAQAYQESLYKIWNYAVTSSASGISQFKVETIWDYLFQNMVINIDNPIKMTDNEISAIKTGISGDINDINSYVVSTLLGQQNRAIMHQNIINNPEIMIKVQFRYMKYIANKYNSLTSNVLFGYSRGPGYIKTTYVDTINTAIKIKKKGYEIEGVDYVYKIFKYLENNFGIYLGMNISPDKFDASQANIDGTNNLYN